LFSYFFIFPSGAPRSIHGIRAKKKKSNPLDAPDDPSPSYISHESRGRRARSSGDGSRCGHPGCLPAAPSCLEVPRPGPQIGRLRSSFGPGIPAPMPSRNAPLRAALEPGRPAALSEFQVLRFSVRPLKSLRCGFVRVTPQTSTFLNMLTITR
jgi:hypothetical protein